MLITAIEFLEAEIAGLKDRTAREVDEAYNYLSRPDAKSKLRPRLKKNGGYNAFSIIWRRLVFYNHPRHRSIFKEIRKGPGHLVPKSRLMASCRTCDPWEVEYIWEKELGFAQVRRKLALLSKGLNALKQFCVIEEGDGRALSVSPSAFTSMAPNDVVKTLVQALQNLGERTVKEVSEVDNRLTEDPRMVLRPRVKLSRRTGAFSLQWIKFACDPVTGLAKEQEIPREAGHSIRRARLLAHCRGCGDPEKEYLWGKEREFVQVRRQVDLLCQAINALKQYEKDGD